MDREDEAKQLIRDFLGTFGTSEGKRVLECLGEFCFENKTTYRKNALESAYAQGARSVILYIKEKLTEDPNRVKQEKSKG